MTLFVRLRLVLRLIIIMNDGFSFDLSIACSEVLPGFMVMVKSLVIAIAVRSSTKRNNCFNNKIRSCT